MSTQNRSFRAVGVVSMLAAAGAVQAQVVASGILVADRDTDSIWLLRDCDSNNSIDAATEVKLFYSGANAAGTQGIANPSMIAARPDGLVLLGDADASGRHWLWLRDLNRDGDALDASESGVFVNASNPSGFLFGFPGGAAFDNAGAAYVSNAGNAFGADAIYRCFDLNGNGNVNDADEVTPYCTTGLFGSGNGSYGPQELTFGTDGALYMRNATPNLHGIYRFVDNNANNDANDSGESAPFFDSSNASGITQSSGFAIEPDRANPGALYTAQVATGSLDQIIRVRDLNGNNNANDAGEATVVWSTTESGFNIVDVVSLPDGRLFVTGASGAQILVLQDVGNDGTFTQPEDRTTFFANGQASLQTARQMTYLYAAADVDGNFSVAADDIFAYLDRWFAQTGQSGASLSADFNNDGTVTADDIFAFLDAWFNPTLGC